MGGKRKENIKYFYNLEKRNDDKKVPHRLNCGKGFITTDQKKILAQLVDYYKHLYSGSNYTKSQINDLDRYLCNKGQTI